MQANKLVTSRIWMTSKSAEPTYVRARLSTTRVAAADLLPEIRVNAYAPGTVETAMVDRMLAGISAEDGSSWRRR